MNVQHIQKLFASQLAVANVGVDVFCQAVQDQKVPAVQVDWRPPAGGDVELAQILAKLQALPGNLIEEANREGFSRMDASDPEWTGMVYAHEVLPDMDKYTIGHAGPPLAWEDMCGPMQGAVLGAIRYEGLW